MGLPSTIPINLGDIECKVKMIAAVSEDDDSDLHMYCEEGHPPARVKMPATCTSCGLEGTRFSFGRGRDNGDGTVTMLSQEELAGTREKVKAMVVTAHPRKTVEEHTFTGKSYLLVPSGAVDVEGYSTLRQTLEDSPDVALVTTFAIQTKTQMFRLRLHGDGIAATILAWPENVREAPAIPRVMVVPELRDLANEWVSLNEQPFDPAAYTDASKAAREKLLAEKAGVAAPVQGLPDKVPSNVSTGLLERLRKSVDDAKAAKGEPAKPAKKAVAKKTAARKSA